MPDVKAEDHGQQKPCCFIVTVGTSLLADGHLLAEEGDGIAEYESHGENDYKRGLAEEKYSARETPQGSAETQIKQAAKRIFRSGVDKSDGAELCALFSPMPQSPRPFDNPEDKVVLFGTRTKKGAYCAEALKRILLHVAEHKGCHSGIECVDAQFPEYLGLASDPEFPDKGLGVLLSICYDVVCRYKDTHTVILVPNGGYKALIPYLTVVGILKDLPVRYIYEETTKPMELPHFPLGPDVDLFGSHQIALESLLDQPWDQPAVDKLHKSVRELLRNHEGKLDFNPLGRFLWDSYRTQVDMSPLGRATAQDSLLQRLNEDLRAKFVAISQLDHLIWKGDRVPEMVEHAARHHTNLFVLANRVLLPCFDCLDDFLSPKELFILLCALLLHDCGHVVGSVSWPAWKNEGKEVLFPGEVREFHNILGYLRLEQGFNTGDQLHAEIKKSHAWNGLSDASIWNQFLKAPAVAGLFHRQAMPLHTGDRSYSDCGFFNPVEPLQGSQWRVQCGDEYIEADRMLRVVALLRLIDSLDNQGSRTGGASFVRFHLCALQAEIEEMSAKIREFEEHGGLGTKLKDEISCYCNTASQVNKATDADRKTLHALLANNPSHRYLIRHYMELLLEKRFKELQKEHYGEHLPVKRVVIEPQCDTLSSGGPRQWR